MHVLSWAPKSDLLTCPTAVTIKHPHKGRPERSAAVCFSQASAATTPARKDQLQHAKSTQHSHTQKQDPSMQQAARSQQVQKYGLQAQQQYTRQAGCFTNSLDAYYQGQCTGVGTSTVLGKSSLYPSNLYLRYAGTAAAGMHQAGCCTKACAAAAVTTPHTRVISKCRSDQTTPNMLALKSTGRAPKSTPSWPPSQQPMYAMHTVVERGVSNQHTMHSAVHVCIAASFHTVSRNLPS